VHVHVTKSFKISSPSVPFQFADLAGYNARAKYTSVRSTNAVVGDCDRVSDGETYSGSVAVTEVWSGLVTVAKGTRSLDVLLEGGTREDALDLSVMSPGGRHYARYADSIGFTDEGSRFRISEPEPGQWRLLVRGMRGTGEPLEFRVRADREVTPTPSKPPKRAPSRARPQVRALRGQ
jgi:hypothetical protein